GAGAGGGGPPPSRGAGVAPRPPPEAGVPDLPALVAELETQTGVMQPEVREALARHLRPVVG
ncbi:MAG: hypothetical protein LPK08_08280, partial [Halomonas sp.]|nr:hypothetical protein [Halomonas sp.]